MINSIWFINDYAGSPQHGMTQRHYYLARSLVERDIDCTIISASFSHLLTNPPVVKKNFTQENVDGINYLWIRVPKYRVSFSFGRIFKWLVFCLKLFFIPVRELRKPDAIIVSPSAPFAILPAWFLAKRLGAKLVFEVRDIWPLTLVSVGGISPRHPLIIVMAWFELFALRKSDIIISNLYNYTQHIVNLGIDRRAIHIPNGIFLEPIKLDDKKEGSTQTPWKKIHLSDFVVGYAGKLGKSNALEDLISAARMLKDHNRIKFVLVGAGQERQDLISAAAGLDNVTFLDAIPKLQVPALLSEFDVCYVGLKDIPLFRFGTSPNKLFDYLLAGKPVIHAINDGENLVSKANAGLTAVSGDSKSIANSIVELSKLPIEQLAQMGENGRRYVLEHHDYRSLAEKLVACIDASDGISAQAK